MIILLGEEINSIIASAMDKDKERKDEIATSDEAPNGFLIPKWDVTSEKISEIRDFIAEHKSKDSCIENSISQKEAKEIREKITR